MRYLTIITCFSFWLVAGICGAGESLDFKDEQVRLSYSIGYQISGDFLRQSQDINPELVLKGIEDALAGTNTRMTPAEMAKTLTQLQDKQ